MTIISRYLERRAAEKVKALIEKDAARVKRLAALQREVEKAETLMFSKPCPIAATKCHRECVHFKPGRARTVTLGDEVWFHHTAPECKLWKG
jgi:hypothetical protein